MSKRKRRRPVPVKQNNTASAKQAAPIAGYPGMTAMDGYINSLAYLGEASPLNRANDYERHSVSNDFDTLTILYRENWLAARIIDTPCEDMTRAWYSISSEIDQEKLDELAKLEAKHNVKQEITNAIRWGRLYGGAAAVMVIEGQEDMLDEPMDYDMLQPGCFRGLIVVDRVRGIFPSIEIEEDMSDPEFGYPKWYDVTIDEESGNIVRVHHSRLLLFKGRELPIDEEINADYWGASEIEHVYEELQKRNSTSANIAQLVFQANVAAIKLSDYGEVLGMGSEQQKQQMYRAIAEMNRLRTSFGITLMSRDDDYEQHPYSFAGVAEVYETFMMDMAGAAEIPATKLFGRAPQGMNATGESDMKNYYEMIGQLQERILKPALEKLLPVMAMSLWGVIPEDMEIVFEPLGSSTPSERAEIMGQFANPIIQAFQAGLISQKVALLELRETGKPINAWTNISDEDVENAEDEVDQGEAMQDPMAAMGGMSPQAPPEEGAAGPEQEMPAEQPEIDPAKAAELKERVHELREQPEQDEIDPEKVKELKSRVQEARARQSAEKEKADKNASLRERIEKIRAKGEAEDGGPGSGPRPGYHKNGASIAERVKFMANPAASIPQSPNPQRTPESVKKANSERKEWSDLTLHQKVAGNSAQERHMRKVRRDVMRAAAKGDIRKAKQVLLKNKQYFQNDPASAMKVQSEALQRQKKARRSILGDVLSFFRKPMEDGGPGSGNFNHAGRPGKRGGSASGKGGSGAGSGESSSNNTYTVTKKAALEAIKDPKRRELAEKLWKDYPDEIEFTLTNPEEPMFRESSSPNQETPPIDNGPETAYNSEEKRMIVSDRVREVNGPKDSKRWAREYAKQYPEIMEDARKYMPVMKNVMEFSKNHPDIQNCTCDALTGEIIPPEKIPGFCVTFHQNLAEDNPYGGYAPEDYALMCAIAKRELGTDSVYIGVYGNPEVSFPCKDMQKAMDFARVHNQETVYDPESDDLIWNGEYDRKLNPIKHGGGA